MANDYSEHYPTKEALIEFAPEGWSVSPNRVELVSDEYGFELFEYDTAQDAQEGYQRLQAKIAEAKASDGIERTLTLFTEGV